MFIICLNAILNKSSKNEALKNLKNKPDLKLIVKGMTCNHCKETVTEVINSYNNVNEIKININTGEAFIFGNNLDENKIINSINEVGFSVGERK